MWQIDNRTPYAAERRWVRDREGAEVWLVAVKCVFDIQPDGTTKISGEQSPPNLVPKHLADPAQSSVLYDADLVLTKTTTDITVMGHAHAPGGRAVDQLDVGFRVGSVQKLLRVFGDRTWNGSSATSPLPFERMPLTYERAFGGRDAGSPNPDQDWDWRNPAGIGFCTSAARASGLALPNIEYPDQLISSWSDRPVPAGFGPIAAHWQPRAVFAGTYDERWRKTRDPLLPDDFDDRFFQSAPMDQQPPQFLNGGEPVALKGLMPSGELQFHLPRVFLRLETEFTNGAEQTHERPRLYSVIIEPDTPRVSLVFQSSLPCHHRVHELLRTVVTTKPIIRMGQEADSNADEDAELA
jgi:hypothetical protein